MNKIANEEKEIRKPKKPKRSAKSKNSKNVIIGLVVLVGLLYVGLDHFNNTYIYSNNIAKNIFIENIEVSNMTKEQAIETINKSTKPKDIKLAYEDKKYTITPEEINLKYNVSEAVDEAYNYTKENSYLENVKRYFLLGKSPKNIELKPSYDEAMLSNKIEELSKSINVDMVNAKVYISSGGQINSTSSITGKELDIASTKESIYNMIESKSSNDLSLKVNVKEPDVKTKDAQSVNTLLAQYSTKFSTGAGHEGRNENIRIASKRTSDILLMPGEEFSYNNLTGTRTKANGYKDAGVIVNGKIEQGAGGGVCQVSSTIYNSVLYSGLELTSIRNHSLKSTYVPIGRDATVTDGGIDFRFKNPYNNPVYIKNTVSNGVVTSRIYGNSNDKKNIEIKVDAFKENGLDAAKTYRVYKDANGKVSKKQYIAKSVYKKTNKS